MTDAHEPADPGTPGGAGPSPGRDAARDVEQERAAALDRLRRGYDDGWLSADEHELRATLARRARTHADLERALRPGPLEPDGAVTPVSPVPPLLPLPGAPPVAPEGASGTGDAGATLADAGGGDGAGTGTPDAPPTGASGGVPDKPTPAGKKPKESKGSDGLILVPQRVAGAAQGLMVFGALALFFTTGSWLWFLLIPVMGIVFGSGVPERDWEERRQARRARKDARRLRRGRPPIPGEVVERRDEGGAGI